MIFTFFSFKSSVILNSTFFGINLFSDKSYYYVTSGNGNGKRIQEAVQPTGLPNMSFTKYDAIKIYEKDLVNKGMTQYQAHIEASKKYNYNKEATEFYDKIKKFKKE